MHVAPNHPVLHKHFHVKDVVETCDTTHDPFLPHLVLPVQGVFWHLLPE